MHFGKSRSSAPFHAVSGSRRASSTPSRWECSTTSGFSPPSPGPVNIELFASGLFGFSYEFEENGPQRLGYVSFGRTAPTRVAINARIDNPPTSRQTPLPLAPSPTSAATACSTPRSTSPSGATASRATRSPENSSSPSPPALSKKPPIPAAPRGGEYQANRLMAALLMPAPRVLEVLDRHWLPAWGMRIGPTGTVTRSSSSCPRLRREPHARALRVDDLFQKATGPPSASPSTKAAPSPPSPNAGAPTLFAHLREAA